MVERKIYDCVMEFSGGKLNSEIEARSKEEARKIFRDAIIRDVIEGDFEDYIMNEDIVEIEGSKFNEDMGN